MNRIRNWLGTLQARRAWRARGPASDLTIHVHLGAHKTASTYLQRVLHNSRELLLERDITVSIPRQLRAAGWTNAFRKTFWRDAQPTNDQLERLRSFAPESGLWILSEENLLGGPKELAWTRTLYPRLPRSLVGLRTTFPTARIELFLAVRSYDAFFRSCYSEMLRYSGYRPFEEFYEAERFARFSWVDVVGRLLRVAPARSIHTWRYEDLAEIEESLLRRMTTLQDVSGLMARRPGQPLRTCLSQAEVEALGQDASEAATAPAEKNPNDSSTSPAFDPWSAPERTTLQARYDADITRLVQQHPNLWIRPGT